MQNMLNSMQRVQHDTWDAETLARHKLIQGRPEKKPVSASVVQCGEKQPQTLGKSWCSLLDRMRS